MSDPAQTERLGERSLTIVDAIAQSAGYMGPVFSVAILFPLIVGASNSGKGAGIAAPTATLLAASGTGGLAWTISRYAKKVRTCGTLYDYATLAIGQGCGFVAGWVYYGAALVFAVSTPLILSGLTSDFLRSQLHIDVAWWIIGLVVSAILFAIQYYGVKIATRAQLIFTGFSGLTILVFSIWVIIKSPTGLSAQPFDLTKVGFTGIFFGVIYGFSLFIGFETAANLAEECSEPTRAIPRALLGTLVVIALYFFVTAYAQALGFGLNAKAWASSAIPLTVLGGNPRYGSTLLANVLTVIILCDAFAVAVGCWVVATRGIYKLARDRQIYRGLAKTHERHGTPVAAAWFVLALGAGTIILTHVTNGVFSRATENPKVLVPQYAPLFYWLATFGPFLFLLIYLVTCVTAPIGLPGREGRRGLCLAVVVGMLMISGALFGTLYKAPSPYSLVPWYTAAWLALGFVWLFLLRLRRTTDASEPIASREETLVAAP